MSQTGKELSMSFWIVTDACCDLPGEYIRRQEKLKVMPMLYQADDDEQILDLTDDACGEKTQ